jgi:PAS domain S-box-containing protein
VNVANWTFVGPPDAFIEAVPDGIAVYDLEGRVVRSNRAYRDTLARFIPHDPPTTLRERVKASPMRDIEGAPLPEEQWPHTRMLRGEAILATDAVEVMMYTTDGEALYMSVTGAPLYAEDGQIIGAIAVHRDITAQKQLERELRQSRDELQAILEAVPDQVIVYDTDLQLVRSNATHRAAVARFHRTGEAPEELTARIQQTRTVFHDLSGVELAEGDWPQQRILRGEILSGPNAVETQAYTVTGEAQWWSVSGAPLRAEDGAISGAVLINTDITRRKELENDLRRANDRFRLAERAANGFVFEWNPNDGIHYRSEGFERLLGYRPEEIAPTWAAWAQLVYPGDWQVSTDAEEVAYLEALPGETLENEYRMRHRDGHYLTVAEQTLIERDQAGHVVRLIGQIHDITERKRLENELAQRVSLLTAVFNAVPDRLTIVDASGEFVQLNAAAARLEEQERGRVTWENLGETLQPRTPDGEPFPVQEIPLLRALRGETVSGVEVQFRDATGRDQSSLNSAAPFYDHAGHLQGAVTLAHDVTALRAAERAAAERAAQLDAVFEALTDAFFVYDAAGQITRMNEAARALLALDAMPTFPTLSRAERAALLNVRRATDQPLELDEGGVNSLLQGGPHQIDFEFRLTALDGAVKDVSLTGGPIRDPQGKVIGAVTLLRDVTERRQLEQAIVQSEARLRTLTEALPQLVWSASPDGTATYVNSQWEAYTGVAAADVLGAGWLTTVHPEDREATAAAWSTAVATGGDYDTEYRIRRFDGAYRWFKARGVALHDHDGAILQWFGTCTDIQDLRETQDELEMARDHLELRVRDRTRELAKANRSLRRLSQQVLEVQERERRTIALELHEEIGQALTGAKMLLELVERSRSVTSTDSERIREARTAVDEALEQVRDLSLDLRPGVLDSLGLLPALRWLFERYTRQTGVQVRFSADGLDQRLPASIEIGVYRLIQEALTNVSRHAGADWVTVQVETTVETLTLYVVDSGVGFEAEEALAVGHSTGLAGMIERASLLGGTAAISSMPGAGTTIEATIPLAPDAEAEQVKEVEYDAR